MALKYTTTLQFAEVIGAKKDVPTWDIGATPSNEAVGEGDDSATQYFLDQKNIIANSYTLYANDVAMTETTDYALDKDTGEITLTGGGVTKLSTNHLTAKYKYFDNGMSDSHINTTLERAEQEVDKAINSTFTDGTATNPTYPLETEIQASQGIFRDRIIVEKKPLIDVETTLDGDLAIDATTIPLTDASGYPTSGAIIIGSEIITYTGITSNNLTTATRGALDSDAATHTDLDAVHSTILLRSDSIEGDAVVWTVQPWGTSMNATAEGLIYKFQGAAPEPLTREGVAERVKILYYHGYDSVPADITRLALLFAKKMLITDNIGKAMIAGRNEFRPEMLDADREEGKRIVNSYIVLPMGNT